MVVFQECLPWQPDGSVLQIGKISYATLSLFEHQANLPEAKTKIQQSDWLVEKICRKKAVPFYGKFSPRANIIKFS